MLFQIDLKENIAGLESCKKQLEQELKKKKLQNNFFGWISFLHYSYILTQHSENIDMLAYLKKDFIC